MPLFLKESNIIKKKKWAISLKRIWILKCWKVNLIYQTVRYYFQKNFMWRHIYCILILYKQDQNKGIVLVHVHLLEVHTAQHHNQIDGSSSAMASRKWHLYFPNSMQSYPLPFTWSIFCPSLFSKISLISLCKTTKSIQYYSPFICVAKIW